MTPSHDWDAIVIGSGLGGLSTAAHLATNGMRTLVLEQYDVAGGCSHVFRRKRKYEWDVGVHYVGDCGPSGVIPRVFKGLGLADAVEWRELDPDGFDTVVIPGLTFRVPRGWDRYLERLIETFPDEEGGLRECVGILQRIARGLRGKLAPTTPEEVREFISRSPNLVQWGMRTLAELLDETGLSKDARAVICAQSGDYGTPPSRAAVSVHAGALDHLVGHGAYYPAGGGQVLPAMLLEVIHAHGGRVRTRARVTRIRVQDKAVRGVELDDGEQLDADIVVSDADLKRTFLELLSPDAISVATRERVEGARMAPPVFTVYLAMDVDIAELMPNTQIWAPGAGDVEATYRACSATTPQELELDPSQLLVYITSTSWKDRGNPHIAPPGESVLEIMSLVSPSNAAWQLDDTQAQSYSASLSYRAAKARMMELLIGRADELLPGLREHIVWKEASSPLTTQRYTRSTDGASNGLDFAPDQMAPAARVP